MLKLAAGYITELNRARLNVMLDERNRYYFTPGSSYTISSDTSMADGLEFVSVDSDNNNILGYLYAGIDRINDRVTHLSVCRYTDNFSVTFSRDFRTFLVNLFEKFNVRKIEFGVIIGNPIEDMYDKYISKYGGSIVGYLKQTFRLYDNKYYDYKMYEIFREDYLLNKNKHINEIEPII